jgi:hypothetical protein
VVFAVLTLNFAHFREDSSRAKAALPRRYADTPIRRYNRHMWLRLHRAVIFCEELFVFSFQLSDVYRQLQEAGCDGSFELLPAGRNRS